MGGSGWRSYSALGTDKEPGTAVDFIHHFQNVLDNIEQEDTRWKDSWTKELDLVKQEIDFLKRDGEKRRRASELLQVELTNFRDEAKSESLDWQTKISGEVTVMSKYVVGLKNSVSHLKSDQQHLNQRMEAHENNTQLKREVTDWLQRELRTRLGEDTAAVVLRPELQVALEALEHRLLRRVSLDQHKEPSDVWRTVGEGLQEEGLTALTVKNVQHIVQRALSLYQADGVGMADYALESLGARVIKSKCSKTYHTKSRYFSLFGIPLWYMSESPRAVIQPEVHPGKCWAFEGSEGVFTVGLSMPVRVTHVTLEHVPKSLSPSGHIDSAPKDIAVFGFPDSAEAEEEGEILGRFTYDADGDPIQTFQLPDSAKAVYHAVQLRVLTNWGNPDYSCIYRFRVHSKITPQ
ncbi:SUN domain-containing protein 2-like [Engraulis encrasicolus]|uniref:SUN domain-containing protein 2-like n=1 Tax=Engraulis encrasicolus TaxID=184585 RepID=UPI002FD1AA0E